VWLLSLTMKKHMIGLILTLFEILKSRGFGETWIEWVRKIVIGGSVSVMTNGKESNIFKTGK
jgi:hypothetical protein